MGRELQKRKNRSSISKVRQKPKSKKKVFNNATIAANWDKTQTLSQNYARLGLTAKLGKSTGGVEKKVSDIEEQERKKGKDALGLGNNPSAQISVTEARIERDPKTGRIMKVVEDGKTRPNPLNDPLNQFDDDSESDDAGASFDQHGNGPAPVKSVGGAKTEVLRELEEQASRPAVKYRRNQSEGEKVFVEALVRKYGDNFGKMARDTEINYMQRSEGDLKRRVKKWKESGGSIE